MKPFLLPLITKEEMTQMVQDAMHIISSMQKQVNRPLPDDVKMIVSYTGKKCFNVTDKRFSTMNLIICIILNVQRYFV